MFFGLCRTKKGIPYQHKESIQEERIGFQKEKTKTALSGACPKMALTELLYQELLVGG